MLRRLGKWALYLLVVMIALGLLAYLGRDPLRDRLAHLLNARLSRLAAGRLEIGTLRGSLWRSLILRDVVLRDDQEVVGRLAVLRLTYRPWTLLYGTLTVSVDLVRPHLTLRQASDGAWNVARLFPASPAPATPASPLSPGLGLPFAVALESLQMHAGHIALHLPALPAVQHLDNLHMRLQGQIAKQGLRLTLQQLHMQARPADVELHTLQGTLTWSAEGLQVEGLRLQTGQSLLTATGSLSGQQRAASLVLLAQPLEMTEIGRLLHNDTLQGALRADVQLSGLPEALQLRGELHTQAGHIVVHGHADSVATPPRYQGSLEVAQVDLATLLGRVAWQSDLNGRLDIAGSGFTLEELHGTVHLEVQPSHLGQITLHPSHISLDVQPHRFQVQRFSVDTSVAQMQATGMIDLRSHSALQYSLTANLAALQELLGVPNLQGLVRVEGQAAGEGSALQAQGTLEATQVRYQEHGLQKLHLTYAGSELATQPQGTARLLIQHAQVGAVPIEHVQLDAAYQEVQQQLQFVTEIRQAALYGGNARGRVTLGPAGQQVVVDEVLLRLADHHWRNAAPLDVTLGASGMQISHLRLSHAEEVLEISGALANQQFHDLRLQATQIDLAFLSRLLALSDLLPGRANVQAQLTGTLAAPQLRAALTWRPVGATPPPFEEFGVTLAYADQQLQGAIHLRQDRREVLTGNLTLPLNLTFHALAPEQRFRDAPVTLHLSLKQPDFVALRRWQPVLPALTGGLESTLHLQGTYAALRLDSTLHVQRLIMPGAFEQLSGTLLGSADIVTAASVSDFAQALTQHTLQPRFHNAVLQVPALHGQLPTPQAPRLEIREVVSQATGQWLPSGFSATIQRLEGRVTGDTWPPATVQMAAQITPQRLAVTHLQVRLPQSELRATGHLTLPDQDFQLKLDIPQWHLADVPLALPSAWPRTLQGVLEMHGQTRAPQVQAHLQYAGGHIQVQAAAQLHTPQPQYSATLRLDGVELARLLPGESGQLNLQGQVQGRGVTGAARQAQMTLRAEAPGMTLAPGLALQVRTRWAGDSVQLQELRLHSTPLQVQAQGNLTATDKTGITYTATLGDLRAVSQRLGIPLEAKGRLQGTLRGSLQALRAQGTLHLEDWRYHTLTGKRLQANFAVTQLLTAPQATCTVQVLDVRSPALAASSLRLEGRSTPAEGSFTVAVTAGPYQDSAVAGHLALQGTQRLTLTRLRLHHPRVTWENAGPIQVARTPSGSLEVQRLLLRSGRQELRLQGAVQASGVLQAEVQLQHLQIQPTVLAVMPTAQVPEGQLSLRLQLAGSLQQPHIQGEVQLTALQWQQRDLGSIQGQLSADGTTANLTLRWQDKQRDLLSLQGSIALDATQALALQLQIPGLDLVLLKHLHAAVTDSAGILAGEVRLTGTPRQPQLFGHLAVRDGRLHLVATGERYKDIQARLDFVGNRIDIPQLQVGSRRGTLLLTGWLEHAAVALQTLHLDVHAKDFAALHTADAEAVLSTALTVQGSMQDMAVTGQVEVTRGMLRLDGELLGGPATVQPWQLTVDGVYGPGPPVADPRKTSGNGRQVTPLPFLRADVHVDLLKNVWVRGPSTAIELRGDVQVTKALQGPFITSGTLETVRGFTSVYSKKFTVQEGRVTFTGSADLNPLLDVTATHKVSSYVIAVHIEEKASQPKITLSSTPVVEQPDIISLLVIGKTTDRLTSSEQSSLSSLQTTAGNLVGTQLEGLASQTLGLDTVEIGAGDTPGSARVGAGRYVTQDLFLSYESQLGPKNSSRLGVEYSINRRLRLKGSGSDSGESALDILWRLDY